MSSSTSALAWCKLGSVSFFLGSSQPSLHVAMALPVGPVEGEVPSGPDGKEEAPADVAGEMTGSSNAATPAGGSHKQIPEWWRQPHHATAFLVASAVISVSLFSDFLFSLHLNLRRASSRNPHTHQLRILATSGRSVCGPSEATLLLRQVCSRVCPDAGRVSPDARGYDLHVARCKACQPKHPLSHVSFLPIVTLIPTPGPTRTLAPLPSPKDLLEPNGCHQSFATHLKTFPFDLHVCLPQELHSVRAPFCSCLLGVTWEGVKEVTVTRVHLSIRSL